MGVEWYWKDFNILDEERDKVITTECDKAYMIAMYGLMKYTLGIDSMDM